MENNTLESLLSKAKDLEKKYEWLQAAKYYRKASNLVLDRKDFLKAADLNEKIGFCYFRASLQAKSNIEFKKNLKSSIVAYEKESKILEEIKNKTCKVKKIHANALIAYAKSWYETNPEKIKQLLNKWWTLENQASKSHMRSGDLYSAGKTYNDLVEWSTYDRYWLVSNYFEQKKIYEKCLALAKKTINIFSRLKDNYELARAYLSICWYYGFSESYVEDPNKLIQISQKCKNYANKALELSQEIGDAWLIGRCYQAAWGVAQALKWHDSSAIEFGEKMVEYGSIARDNYLLGFGNCLTASSIMIQSLLIENPDKRKENFEKARKFAQEGTHNFKIINQIGGFYVSYSNQIKPLLSSVLLETDPEKKTALIEKAIKVGLEGIRRTKGWKRLSGTFFADLSGLFLFLSMTKNGVKEKKELLLKAQSYATKHVAYAQEMISPHSRVYTSLVGAIIPFIQIALARIEPNVTKKINLLDKAVIFTQKSIDELKKKVKFYTQSGWGVGKSLGDSYSRLGLVLRLIYSYGKDKKSLCRAIEAYEQASIYYEKADLPVHKAESYWRLAQLHDQNGEFQDAAKAYDLAYEAYILASKKISHLKQFYKDYCFYMLAWSQIEHAKYNHSVEEYEKAKNCYDEAAHLHKSTKLWNYLSSNYAAWSLVEAAEGLSRKENTQRAKLLFEEAFDQFSLAEESIKQKMNEFMSLEEKEMTEKLLKASDLRRRYCQARILVEDAKLLDSEGKYLQSSRSYGEAARSISVIVDKVDVEAERKELQLLAILCRAWQKMSDAEETTSSESYLEAATLFENAKEHCFTRKASLWSLGNSNFCRGLAAGLQYKTTLDLADHARAKGYIKNASMDYLQAGFASASEYAKATQRLFDAYVFINQAEGEIDQEKRAKQYQTAEKLLQISAGSFMKAKQPEKTAQVEQLLKTVKEEKALAASLAEVLQAPTIASSTMSFAAPSPTNEASVGLESFEHANVQANLIAHVRQVKVGESFCLSIEFVNAGKEPALLMRVEDFVPPDFVVVKKPEIYRLEDACLNMKGKQLAPLKLVEAKLVLQPLKKGIYHLSPKVHYLDELGQTKSLQLKSVEINVEEVILADRVSTGTKELDSILLGGIPKEYAVVVTGSPSDERELLIRNFLEAGTREGQTSFFVTTETVEFEKLLEKPGFYLFLCNPKPKVEVPDSPNITKLRSKTDLNNLNMALARTSRNLEQKQQSTTTKRICLETVSDVLLRQGPEVTRRWLSELITDLGSKGFTILAVLDSSMHPVDQANAIINLFDGEINIAQTGVPPDCKKLLIIKKLRNQDYIKNPICLP